MHDWEEADGGLNRLGVAREFHKPQNCSDLTFAVSYNPTKQTCLLRVLNLVTTLRRILPGSSTWRLFFLIAAGLGYPTLNRYDPRQHLSDAAIYAQIATSGSAAAQTHLRFRILVPYLARGVFALLNGQTGTGDSLMFAFLLVNAA